ncbi:xanthine dehydrogenase YagR molybdenum-binding subunit [Sphingomonas zeicaulis]|uniref:xanthine dehydrogenase family protein molybdopterin-binding subunit n=1 Tax=Sphingomonas zeicaulis TaxID=1632740 RepID=UPI003D23AD94
MSVGKPRTRYESAVKVTGAARYAADHFPAGLLHGVLVGSPVAAGAVTAIDAAAAAGIPGVVRILTHRDMPKLPKPGRPIAITHMPLQSDEIQWEGQAIAIVLAETIEAAEEGAALVRPRIAPARAMIPGAGRLVKPPAGGMFHGDAHKGDVPAALARAAVTVKESYFQPTRNHNPMETSACVAQWHGDALTVWDSTQFTQNPRNGLAALFGIPPERVHVIAPHTGGGFGCKGAVYPHEVLAAQAAKLVGRPVRIQLSRAQMYSMAGHQPECRQTITLGADKVGTLAAVRHEAINTTSITDMQFESPGMASATFYASPNIQLDQSVERINLVLSTPMRSPVEGPGSWALESAMDELARKLGIDPLDLRLRNFAEREPLEGKPWSSNRLCEAYQEAARVYGWRKRGQRPRQDGVWSIGHGMSTAGTFVARFPSQARVRVRRGGRVIVESSSNDIGTGNQTAVQLIVADALGTGPEHVEIRWGDSRLAPAGPVYGSSHTIGMGSAAANAARAVRAKLVLKGAPADGPLDLDALMAQADLEEVAADGSFALPGGAPASMNGSGTDYAMGTWGANFVEVGVDRDLGLIRLRRIVARYSAGRIINPLTARSQMIGSIIWEWGKATMEASIIEPSHARFLAKNLSNVAVPVNADIPADAIDVGFVEEYDPHASSIGARGIGELGGTGVAAAIANAVFDAVGVRVREVPILPHHILDGIAGGDDGSGTAI